jgi:hypothetical protein
MEFIQLTIFPLTEGIVERAVLIGAPVSVNDELWGPARKVWTRFS